MVGLVDLSLLYIISSISVTLMLLWEGDPPELELDLRGQDINEILSLQNPDVSDVCLFILSLTALLMFLTTSGKRGCISRCASVLTALKTCFGAVQF